MIYPSYSLHHIHEADAPGFDPKDYSHFKFGDVHLAKSFAQDLFEAFIQTWGDAILATEQDVVILPSPYLSIPTASNALCAYFKHALNVFLFEHGRKAATESKIYRHQTYTTDYGALDFEQRLALIANDTYYIDRNFLDQKFCIFVDDIKITGSHEHTVNKIVAILLLK
jgi:PRTase ComF-like